MSRFTHRRRIRVGCPPSSGYGTCETAKARFWPWLSGSSIGAFHGHSPCCVYRNTSLIRNRHSPKDNHRSLGMILV